jgi:gluconate 2-dehydrogenase gamma chain
LNRRDLIRTALTGTGALSVQGQAQAQVAAKPAATKAAWKPLLFDTHQNETVIVLSDLIIPATDTPGAKAARVNEYIDLILNDGSPRRRNHFLQGLGWLDGYAIREHGHPFVRCTGEQQVAILTRLHDARDPDLKTGSEFFAEIKRLTASGYYTTKIGIDELNKGSRVPASFACRKNDH